MEERDQLICSDIEIVIRNSDINERYPLNPSYLIVEEPILMGGKTEESESVIYPDLIKLLD